MKGWSLENLKGTPAGLLPANAHLLEPEKKVKKKSKYGNKKTEVDGIIFDSKKEADYYKSLLWRRKLGEIGMLELQVRFTLVEATETERKMEYVADFTFIETATGEKKVVDAKGMKTDVYRIKKKLMKSVLNIDILEV